MTVIAHLLSPVAGRVAAPGKQDRDSLAPRACRAAPAP